MQFELFLGAHLASDQPSVNKSTAIKALLTRGFVFERKLWYRMRRFSFVELVSKFLILNGFLTISYKTEKDVQLKMGFGTLK